MAKSELSLRSTRTRRLAAWIDRWPIMRPTNEPSLGARISRLGGQLFRADQRLENSAPV